MHPDLKVRKVTKEMDNDEAMKVVESEEEEEVILIISTMKIKIISQSKIVDVVNEEIEDVEPIQVQMK